VPEGSHALAGLVAVVTGGAGHLGSAMTAVMAEQGARVIVADLDMERALEHSRALSDKGHDSLAVRVDVADEASVRGAFDQVIAEFGGVDILVNNAAPSRLIATDAQVLTVPLSTWDSLHNVVVRGAMLCTRHALPSMISRGGGSIVNIASIHGHAGDADLSAYPVAKAGLLGFSRVVATQYGRQGVRCNSITLGTIPYPSMSEAARQSKVRHQLLPRVGVPADAANVVAFLASSASSFITGADLVTDGGVLAHLPSYADGGTMGLVRQP
jgi:NAD(P)-dependent dehydrogenase (short-subunit alcohol dehydrogenase family)